MNEFYFISSGTSYGIVAYELGWMTRLLLVYSNLIEWPIFLVETIQTIPYFVTLIFCANQFYNLLWFYNL